VKLLLIATLIVVGSVAAVAVATTGASREECSVATFDTRLWADASSADREPGGGPSSRQRLADRLVECESLQGASRRQVRKLLGRPDDHVARDRRLDEEGTWSYDLGTERGWMGIDDEHLVVRFGRDERVRSAEQATD